MEDLYDPEEKMLCPYDSSHHIRRCKMSFHLVKCKKNHGEQKMVPCDFDATHMIPEPELQYHHQSCPNRKTIEARITKSRTGSENKFPVQNIQVTVSENWDDNYYPSYDPVKYSERNDVLRHMDVESEAKRKNFRLGERQRLNELSKQNQSPSRVPSSDDAVNLPSRLKVTDISEKESSPLTLQEKLMLGHDKVFIQYDRKQNKN